MKRTSKLAHVSVIVLFSALSAWSQYAKIQVVYGKDDRMDVYQVSDPALVTAAASTAAMFPKIMFTMENQILKLLTKSYGEVKELCKDEPFYSQPSGAFCSSFLVAPDKVVTAGHCIADFDCDQYAFVFDYQMKGPGKNPDGISSQDVYTCKRVISREMSRDTDYALVQLDRPVMGRQPLKLSTTPVKKGDPLVFIGNPSGLPTKIAAGANVRRDETGYFVANTDSFGGSSGAAVFNAVTMEVAGLLVRGDEDFKLDYPRKCHQTNKCADGDCRGEDATHIDAVINAMKQAP